MLFVRNSEMALYGRCSELLSGWAHSPLLPVCTTVYVSGGPSVLPINAFP